MKHKYISNSINAPISLKELADLGSEEIAYIRPIGSQEVMDKFPMVRGLQSGIVLWALFSASGNPLAIADEARAVMANAMELDLHPVSLH